jgi:hypothetical protein
LSLTQSPGSIHHRARRRTWNTRRIIVIAFIYGIWFNFIDTIVYCYNNNNICKSLGEIFGGNLYYQPWNVVGHMIPGLFLLLFFWNKKEELAIIELFLAGILISSAVMDSPIWGVVRLYGHDNMPLWHLVNSPPPAHNEPTRDIWVWIGYYYNPIGLYGVWDGPFPSAAVLFWSVLGGFSAAVVLILWQYRQEKNEKPISSIKDLVSLKKKV